MHATSPLSKIVAGLAIVVMSLVASSQANAQSCSGPSCNQTSAAYVPSTIDYMAGYENSYATSPVYVSAPFSVAPVPAPMTYTNSIPVQPFQYVQQPIQTVPGQMAAPIYSQPVSVQAWPAPYAASNESFGVAQPVWHPAQPQSGCANGMCPLR